MFYRELLGSCYLNIGLDDPALPEFLERAEE
jgi:hypothetical protein